MKVKVCKCDRCGAIFEPTARDGDFFSKIIWVGEENFDLIETICETEETYDICDECYNDFQRWMKRGVLKNRE